MKTFKKALAVLLATMMAFSVLAVSVFAENKVIDAVEVTVALPVDGEYASGDWVLDTVGTAITFLQWTDCETEEILFSTDDEAEIADATFVEGGSYMVSITVATVAGYEFAAENIDLSINGYEAELVEVSEELNEVSFTCVFDCDSGEIDMDDSSVTFDQVLSFLKTLLLTFVRFVGSLLGYK